MQKKTEILCSVHNCVYNKDACCNAETISVCCDNCVHQMIVTKRNANPSAADVQNKTVPGAVLFSLFNMRCYGYGHVSYTGHCLNDIRIPIRSRFVFAYISKRACTILSGYMAAVGC